MQLSHWIIGLTLAWTGGGYPLPAPRGFFVGNGKTALRSAAKFGLTIVYFFTQYVQVLASYLEKSGYQVNLNDPTSHNLFATLRPRQSQSRWLSALKLAGCNEPMGTYNLYVSDFVFRWPKVRGVSWPPHYKSVGENHLAHFSQILRVIATSIMDDIIHDHPRLLRCKFGYATAVRSCDVIKVNQNFFLPIASHRTELQQHAWSLQLIKTQQMLYILTLRSRKGHVTWDQLMILTLWGHDIHILMCINEKISMVLLVLL